MKHQQLMQFHQLLQLQLLPTQVSTTHTHTHTERERERDVPLHALCPSTPDVDTLLCICGWLSVCIAQQRNLTAPLQAARLLSCAFPSVSTTSILPSHKAASTRPSPCLPTDCLKYGRTNLCNKATHTSTRKCPITQTANIRCLFHQLR